jgi:hypothetical protein
MVEKILRLKVNGEGFGYVCVFNLFQIAKESQVSVGANGIQYTNDLVILENVE